MDRSVSAGSSADGGRGCGCFALLSVVALVVAAYGVALPIRATVTHASLATLDLVITNTGTVASSSSISVAYSYNLSLTVQLRNRNWAMYVDLTAPLDAELRFAGRRFDGGRLADPGMSFPPRGAKEFRVLAALSPAGEPATTVLQVELRITGKVRYRPVHSSRSRRLEATCPLKLLIPNAPREEHDMVVLENGVVSCY